MSRFLAVALASLLCAAAPLAAEAQVAADGSAASVKDWDVYVDLPTGFAFVKTPARWVFVRQLDAEQMSRLHPTVLVSLLPADDADAPGATRYAAVTPAPRVAARP